MEAEKESSPRFPGGLLAWAGHQSGGVKRLFDPESGRPGKELLRTRLIFQLESWAEQVASGAAGTPKVLLLVGGPGNGKTEAIEHTVKCLDEALGANGTLVDKLSRAFLPPPGSPVARMVRVETSGPRSGIGSLDISIVQDASATAGQNDRSAPELLVDELLELIDGPHGRIYLCCVNRGVLDDALIHSIEKGIAKSRELLERITRAVSLSADAPTCWPLAGFPDIAVWPMDVESLLASPGQDDPSPASVLLRHATDAALWPAPDSCAAAAACPFCHSRALLEREDHRAALLKILRWYELASGKRWSFRDLFSLLSYLLAGRPSTVTEQVVDPCSWAAHLAELDRAGQQSSSPRRHQLTAVFELACAGYQHALFHLWDPAASTVIRKGIKDLGLDPAAAHTRILLGLQHFLADRKGGYLPATIAPLLSNLVELLDPAMASPSLEVAVSARSKVVLGELDVRFSRSIQGGLEFVRKYHALAKLELDLLQRLAEADQVLSSSVTRRRSPASASRLQYVMRDFACRLVRRSLCARSAVVADVTILDAFQGVVQGEHQGRQLYEVAQQVKVLLNEGSNFEVSLTTTFGQPLPPRQKQATLVVPARQVKPLPLDTKGRPASPISFLQVGSGRSLQSIPLTYDLFKAVKDLERGMSPAALPREVVALLDTTRAKLAGPIVRDKSVLEDSKIRIGAEGNEIGQTWDGFVSTKAGVRT